MVAECGIGQPGNPTVDKNEFSLSVAFFIPREVDIVLVEQVRNWPLVSVWPRVFPSSRLDHLTLRLTVRHLQAIVISHDLKLGGRGVLKGVALVRQRHCLACLGKTDRMKKDVRTDNTPRPLPRISTKPVVECERHIGKAVLTT